MQLEHLGLRPDTSILVILEYYVLTTSVALWVFGNDGAVEQSFYIARAPQLVR